MNRRTGASWHCYQYGSRLARSADWQSAVSPNGIRQVGGLPIRDTADCQSTASLRSGGSATMRSRHSQKLIMQAPAPSLSDARLSRSPREDPADDFFDGHFLNVNVAHGQLVQQCLANRNDPVAFDLESNTALVLFQDLAIFGQVLGRTRSRSFALDGNELEIGEPIQHLA